MVNNFVKDNRLVNSGNGTTIEGTKVYRNIPFGPEALAVKEESGIEPAYRDIIPAAEPDPIEVIPLKTAKRKNVF